MANATIGRPGANRGRKYPPEVLTVHEARALVAAASNRAPTGIRNRALITVMYRGGLRLAEALALAPKDVDLDAGTIRVLHGKGDRARTVGLDPGGAAVVGRWIERRKKLGIRSPAVFCTLDGKPLSQQYVRALLPRLAHRAGIEKRVHPHGLRHTHAAELAGEGVPMNVIQQQLGHGSLATTDRYLRHIAPQAVIDVMQARTWSLEAEEVQA